MTARPNKAARAQDERDLRMLEMHDAGRTSQEIAERFGVSASGVRAKRQRIMAALEESERAS